MYVCIHVQPYVCTYTCTHTALQKCVCIYVYVYVYRERTENGSIYSFLSHSENEVHVFWMEEAWKEIVF